MRKIEREMLRAIDQRRNWRSGNTEVVADGYTGLEVKLHGNVIAYVTQNGNAYVNEDTFRRWPTRTTASRLNAMGFSVQSADGGIIHRATVAL